MWQITKQIHLLHEKWAVKVDLRPEGQSGWWKPLGVERKASDVSPFLKADLALSALSALLCSEIARLF